MSIKKGIDLKVNVKPGYFNLIHQSAYEGPCRTGSGRQLTKEFDTEIGNQKFEDYKKTLKTVYDESVVNMLDPELLTWTDEFILRDEQMQKITKDIDKTDLFLFDGVFHQFPASEIAIRYKKPVGIIGSCASADGVAGLRNKNLESYGFIDPQDASRFMRLFRIKKVLRNTHVLVILKQEIVSKGVLSTITDLEKLKTDLGIRFTFLNAEDLIQRTRDITPEQCARAEKIADEIIAGAEKNTMTKTNIQKSAEFYIVIRDTLEKYECNAFTMPCFEVCATKVFDKELKATPCLAHILLKEEGIPSACESDINCLVAMTILMNLSRKAPHMGNTHPMTSEEKTDQSTPSGLIVPDEIKEEKNLVSTWHAVQPRKMKGIDGPNTPYHVQSFTHSGWGATLRYDFNRDKGKTITLLRMHPNGKKMFAVKGEIVLGVNMDKKGCDTGFYWRVADVRDFFKKELEFGHHYAWVFGDYIEDLKEIGDILGIEVVTA